MGEIRNLKKALGQQVSVEAFLAGDFTVRKPELSEVLRSLDFGGGSNACAAVGGSGAGIEASEALEKIAEEVRACRKCELGSQRRNAVPGQGCVTAELVFVGEGPGGDEDACGLPFVGRAGQLLNKIIGAMGLSREDVFICNIIKCRPPGNRDPKRDEIAACYPYLDRQLRILRPKVIVALGGHAAKTLLDTNEAIGRLRGRAHQYLPGGAEEGEAIDLVATYHPAYLLRNYTRDSRGKVWDDMKKVLGLLGREVPGGK
jgi:DNA polymerase